MQVQRRRHRKRRSRGPASSRPTWTLRDAERTVRGGGRGASRRSARRSVSRSELPPLVRGCQRRRPRRPSPECQPGCALTRRRTRRRIGTTRPSCCTGVEGIDRNDWRVDFATCLRQMVDWADRETAIACLDTAITASSPEEVAAAFKAGGVRQRLIAAQARAGSGSGLESIVRQRLESRGHRIQQQVSVPGLGHVDMLVDDHLLLELDGRRFRWSPEAFERDRERDAVLAAAGRHHLPAHLPPRHRPLARRLLRNSGGSAPAVTGRTEESAGASRLT